ncbi:MAG: glutathione S-transferase family protein [Alphaproteobacteria bacterium]|nr:glutathione S-transferase family protein [Alphaproteobacteria bacterium]
MATLLHLPLSPFCRKVRITLSELDIPFALEDEPVWERREAFVALNPAATVPVLLLDDGYALAESQAIVEYLLESAKAPHLLGKGAKLRAEARRLALWFDTKFASEVTDYLYRERIMKRLAGHGPPNSEFVRAGVLNLEQHLRYVDLLLEKRHWLAGNDFSLADIAAGAHLSSLDYMGAVPWSDHPPAHEWYARFKSRPSVRPLLSDRVPGWRPAPHYANLDF